VAGADGDGQRVHPGLRDKVARLLGVGQHLVVAQFALGADAVFFASITGFERAQTAELTLHRHAHRMRHLAHLAGDVEVVLVAGRGFAVRQQRAVHHHAGKARADRLQAHRRRRAVVLVHHHRNVRVGFDRGQHHVAQVGLARVFARAGRGLQDHRAVGFLGRFHDGLDLLQVVDVERGHAVPMLGGMVQHLAKGNKGHERSPGGQKRKI